ncbi:MAG: hypothetical protein MUC96_16955 [Myxococcaceae bacterium]|jgi:hypothetical protein|nr:hypothetical protein [Myxococcaceae bacterium]
MTLAATRSIAVAVGDGLAVLADFPLSDYPTPAGLSFEQKAAQVAERLAALVTRTRQGWKKELLELVQKEVAGAIEKARAGDEEGSHRLFVDAEMHFRQYERGDPPKATFVAGPDGQLVKAD